MKTAAVIANGSLFDYDLMKPLIEKHTFLIVADGGLFHCEKMQLMPTVIIGDLDSVSQDYLTKYATIEIKKFPVDKDFTDLELAIQEAFHRGAETVTLFGALGKRIDHSLQNINLLYRFSGKLFIESEYETLFMIDKTMTVPCEKGQTVSLIPMSKAVKSVTTSGLKWDLKNRDLNTEFYSISNRCINDTFQITIGEGLLICCLIRNL